MNYQKCVRKRFSDFFESPHCKDEFTNAGLLSVAIEMLAVIADELHEMNEHQKAEKVQEYKDLTDLFTDLIKEELNEQID